MFNLLAIFVDFGFLKVSGDCYIVAYSLQCFVFLYSYVGVGLVLLAYSPSLALELNNITVLLIFYAANWC